MQMFDFFSPQFRLPEDAVALAEELERYGGDKWIVKPCPSGCDASSVRPVHTLAATARQRNITVRRCVFFT